MTYPILAALFFATIFLSVALIFLPRKTVRALLLCWYLPYAIFILFFTGPRDLHRYPPQASSPYKLPWQAGVTRFVAQGNRSFTSHRDVHEGAWDFVMPNGTEVLAARDGKVVEVIDQFDGIGFNSNVLYIEHEDGQRSGYAHIQRGGALVKVGDFVKQGQPIALSGMVGQTLFPHVHFFVTDREERAAVLISFRDAGVPLAGRFYTSGN